MFQNALDSLSLASSLSEQKKHVLEKELNIMITQSEKTLTEKPPKKMPELQNKAFFLPRISYGQNEKIPCASDCITIKNSKKMGRCLVATRDITIGDVLAVEEPFVSFLMPEFRHTHCYNCYLKCHTLLPCHYCSMAMFCSESCRKASWEKNHSIICSVSPYLDELGRAVNLSLLIIIKASRNYKSITELYQQVKSWEGKDFPKNYFDENGQYGSQDYKNIYNLVTNSEKRPLEHSFRSAALAFYVLKCLEDESKFFTSFIPSQSRPFDVKLFIGGVLLRHLQNTTYNAYTVFESYRFGNTDKSMDYREIGAAVYATMSLMNHSCDPNVNRFNCNDTLILRVIQPIKKGEQVLASYGPHFYIQERDERILELKNNYCFTCKCEACRNNWPKEPSMSLDKLKYKCQTCGFGLPAAQTREHVICSNCKFLNNVEEISTLVKKSFVFLSIRLMPLFRSCSIGSVSSCQKTKDRGCHPLKRSLGIVTPRKSPPYAVGLLYYCVSLRDGRNALDCLALASSLPDHKKQQLEEELTILMGQSLEAVPEKNTEHLVESQNDTSILPKISFGPNEKIPCASDCIDIHSSKDMGRCVVATRDINIGDVLGVEEPFASVLLPQFYYTHCYNCYLRCCTLLPCHYCSMCPRLTLSFQTRSKTDDKPKALIGQESVPKPPPPLKDCTCKKQVMYCSESCRKASWEKNHCVDCTLLPYLHKQDSNTIEMLAVRIIITASRDYESPAEFYRQVKSWKAGDSTTESTFDGNGQYVSQDYKNIYNIVTNTEKRSVADLFKRAVTAARILQCFENKSNFFTSFSSNELLPSDFKLFIGGLLLRHLQNLPCNAHEVSESLRCENDGDVLKCVEIGAAAYATMSLVNHSCDPNVVRHSYRDTVVLRAIRLIKKDEQVLDNYGYHYALHEKEERQSHLKDQYYFTCDCEACHDDWPTYFNLNSDKPTYKCQTCDFSLPALLVGEDVICEHCKCSNNIKEILTLLNESSKDYDRHLISVLSGSHDNAVVQQMIEHLEKLDQYIKRPWQEYNNCQEAIKQCYMKLGNYYESDLQKLIKEVLDQTKEDKVLEKGINWTLHG
uniref:Protein-lysine N-methyltransferase SMYD4 n=1 Tax=Timema poppense TaxID=170557 RepID=A0A7R9DCG2_TIMPO|nr:unnamed protein product [Timema poppensis]